MNQKMKTVNYMAAAAAAMLLLASCARELVEVGGNDTVDGNTLAFALEGQIQTRAAVSQPETRGINVPMGEPVDGTRYFLSETITDLNAGMPMTKGTPAYTENVATLYKAFGAVAYPPSATQTPVLADGAFTYVDARTRWERDLGSTNIWKDNESLYFYMRMPQTAEGVGTLSYSAADGHSISFPYTSPASSADQQDILFAGRSVSKEERKTVLPVTFYHALTGIRFAIANHLTGEAVDGKDQTETHITKVEFIGLKGKGTCTVTPDADQKITWTGLAKDAAVESYFLAYNDTPSKEVYDKTLFPDSFFAEDKVNEKHVSGTFSSSDWNLNDANGSLTFWLIPQAIEDNTVTLRITFYLKTGDRVGKDITREITLPAVTWEAGQLRTYVIKADEVDVLVDDKIVNNVKQDVEILNTGNVPEYIRALIVANWVDGNGHVVLGYDAETEGSLVAPWALNAAGTGANYGTFSDLPGAHWVYSNGYYYYTEALDVNVAAATPIFASYAGGTAPAIWKPGATRTQATGVHLQMDIVVQAIEKKDYATYTAAWEAAETVAESYRITY